MRSYRALFFNGWDDGRAPGERPAASVLVIFSCAAVVVLFWPTIATLVQAWSESRTYAHGFLVIPGTCFLLWCHCDRVVTPAPHSWGWLAAAGPAGAWAAGSLAHSLTMQQIAVLSMVPCLVYAVWGKRAFRQWLLSLGFLIFALPVGASLEPWLQDITTKLLTLGLRTVGIPFHHEGYFITLPSGRWEVAPDCGGLRYLLPGLALGYLYVALMYRRAGIRVYFLVLCAVALILANGVRAYGIMVADYLGIADGTDHRVFSYTVYGVTIFLLAWLGRRWTSGADDSAVPDIDHSGPPLMRTAAANAARAVALLACAPLVAWLAATESPTATTGIKETVAVHGKKTVGEFHVHAPSR